MGMSFILQVRNQSYWIVLIYLQDDGAVSLMVELKERRQFDSSSGDQCLYKRIHSRYFRLNQRRIWMVLSQTLKQTPLITLIHGGTAECLAAILQLTSRTSRLTTGFNRLSDGPPIHRIWPTKRQMARLQHGGRVTNFLILQLKSTIKYVSLNTFEARNKQRSTFQASGCSVLGTQRINTCGWLDNTKPIMYRGSLF